MYIHGPRVYFVKKALFELKFTDNSLYCQIAKLNKTYRQSAGSDLVINNTILRTFLKKQKSSISVVKAFNKQGITVSLIRSLGKKQTLDTKSIVYP